MEIYIPFGKDSTRIKIPEKNFFESLEMPEVRKINDIDKAVKDSLENPINSQRLEEIAKGKKSACIIVFDITRTVPNKEILNPVLKILNNAGIKKESTKLLVATGTHRPNTAEELNSMLSADIVSSYQVFNHDCHDDFINKEIGKTSNGYPIKINRNFLDADLKILTGTIEQHVWAGFGGGCKGICPGIASFETIMSTHNPAMLDDDTVTNGELEGNKFYEVIIDIARLVKPDFMCNAVLDKYKNPMGFYSGDPIDAHRVGSKFCASLITLNYSDYADIVIAGGGGYPLDLTLYQAVKPMIQGRTIVKKGGTIIIIAKCSEGIGNKEFKDQLFLYKDMNRFIEKIYNTKHPSIDQWQVQELVKSIKIATVMVYAPLIKNEDFPHHALSRIDSVEEGIRISINRYGENSRISVIRDAPYVIPKVVKVEAI